MAVLRVPVSEPSLTGNAQAARRVELAICERVSAEAACSLAREHSHEKAACSASLPAEAARTVVTARPARGADGRSPTTPTALQAPMQRVQLVNAPIA